MRSQWFNTDPAADMPLIDGHLFLDARMSWNLKENENGQVSDTVLPQCPQDLRKGMCSSLSTVLLHSICNQWKSQPQRSAVDLVQWLGQLVPGRNWGVWFWPRCAFPEKDSAIQDCIVLRNSNFSCSLRPLFVGLENSCLSIFPFLTGRDHGVDTHWNGSNQS